MSGGFPAIFKDPSYSTQFISIVKVAVHLCEWFLMDFWPRPVARIMKLMSGFLTSGSVLL